MQIYTMYWCNVVSVLVVLMGWWCNGTKWVPFLFWVLFLCAVRKLMSHPPFCYHAVTFLLSWTAMCENCIHTSVDRCVSFSLCLTSAQQHGPHTGSQQWYHILPCSQAYVECCLWNQWLTETHCAYDVRLCMSRRNHWQDPSCFIICRFLQVFMLRFIRISCFLSIVLCKPDWYVVGLERSNTLQLFLIFYFS